MVDRFADTRRFYALLKRLNNQVGGVRNLADCNGRMNWPRRGVYFFFENGEARTGSGEGLRVVRVGTHALKARSRTTLWKRLRQHRGTREGGGHRRGSIFRLIVGSALALRDNKGLPPSWDLSDEYVQRHDLDRDEDKRAIAELERRVSFTIGAMRFLWLDVGDEPGPCSARGLIERNAIALLSGWHEPVLDPPSHRWLGCFSNRERVSRSGLWNNNHVDDCYDPAFLDDMEAWIDLVDPR